MNRYLILEDGAAQSNADTLALIEKDKTGGWIVADILPVRIIVNANGTVVETTQPAQGLRAAKVVLK